jgi:hypothetical protein
MEKVGSPISDVRFFSRFFYCDFLVDNTGDDDDDNSNEFK